MKQKTRFVLLRDASSSEAFDSAKQCCDVAGSWRQTAVLKTQLCPADAVPISAHVSSPECQLRKTLSICLFMPRYVIPCIWNSRKCKVVYSNRKVDQQLPGAERWDGGGGAQAWQRGCEETFGSDGHLLPWSGYCFHRCVWTYVKSSWILYLKYMPFILSQLFNNKKKTTLSVKTTNKQTKKWFK